MQLLTRSLLAALVAGLVTPAAPPVDTAALATPPPPAALAAPTPAPPAAAAPGRADHRHLSAAWSTLFSQSARPSAPHRRRHHHQQSAVCPSCGLRRALLEESVSSPDDLTALRIEFVKQQILKKLGLEEPPVVAKPPAMPKPLALAGTLLPAVRHRDDNQEDFYGRTDQVILFPTEGECGNCTVQCVV